MKKILLLTFTLATLVAMAQQDMPTEVVDARWMKANYTKAEYMIPMRDGVKLYTAVYAPKKKKSHHPILILRTPNGCQPYGKKSVLLWEQEELHNYLRGEYILVFQDVRGRGMSEGEFVHMRPYIEHKQGSADIDESSDTYDTIEWLLRKLKRHNGNVGLYGCGYDGFYAVMGAASGHPAIKAVSPQAPIVGWNDGYIRRNGALAVKDSIPDDVLSHPNYDEWWQARDIRKTVGQLSAPMLLVGSSYDTTNPYGTWLLYQSVRKEAPTLDCRLVIGPWGGDVWHNVSNLEGQNSDDHLSLLQFRNEIEFPFFESHLQGAENVGLQTQSLIFFTGEECWREMDYWDMVKYDPLKFFFHEDGSLQQNQSREMNSYSSYLSDLQNLGPNNRSAVDITDSDSENGVLAFTSPVLEEDVTLVDNIMTELYVSISQSDADFVVNVVDVGPNSEYERLISSDIMRGRYRKSATNPEYFNAEQVEKINLITPATPHTFMSGHRIKIEVQSSMFPRYDRNPQQNVDINNVSSADYKPCEVKIYHDEKHPSNITLSVMR